VAAPSAVAPQPQDLRAVAQAAWDHRDERIELDRAIAIWAELARRDELDADGQTRLARAYFLLGDVFVAPTGDGRTAAEVFDRGLAAAERGLLGAAPEIELDLAQGQPLDTSLTRVGPAGQAAMFWYACNLWRAAAADMRTAALYRTRVAAALDRVLALDPLFFYGAADRQLGVILAKSPAFLDGDIERSRLHFERALALAPAFLPTRVHFAEAYAQEANDRDLWTRLLTEVAGATAESLPDAAPEQRLAITRARELLARASEVF
jgi:tetratricopeptide (TPR) repeat protein